MKEPKARQIRVNVYFGYDDDGTSIIDEDGMRDEFETKLRKLTGNIEDIDIQTGERIYTY